MYRKTKICRGLMLAFGGTLALGVPSAFAQQTLERVEVTGSSIKRVDAENALPITIIRREEIERTGATTVQDLVNTISANNGGGYSLSGGLGDAARPGFSGASLRALGSANTLVLLNGRRLAVYAFDGGAVSLNDIPLELVDRIEVLRDGASSTYGSDAIAGVINLVTRRDFKGGVVSLNYLRPVHSGGRTYSGSATVGIGDLAADKFNIWASVGHGEDKGLKANERSFSSSAYRPDLGVNRLSSNAFPANVATPGLASPGANFYNGGAGCLPPTSFGLNATDKRCRFDYASVIDILPEYKRDNALVKGTLDLNVVQLGAEYSRVKNVTTFRISPTPASEATTLNGDPVLVSPSSPYYPTAWVAGNFPSLVGKPLNVYWRSVDAGPRTNVATSIQDRLVLTAEGSVGKWDYGLGFISAKSKVTEKYTNGYLYEDKLLNTGGLLPTDPNYSAAAALTTINPLINVFGPNNAAGLAAIDALKVIADTRISKSSRTGVDGKVSTSDLFALPGGSAGLAVGFEGRREAFSDTPLPILNSGDIIGGSGTQLPVDSSRTVKALFAEMVFPILKNVEATASVRYDKYSDFGNTTNPKLAASWKPVSNMLLRGSVGTGFRAPTLPDLFQPLQKGNTNGVYDDPIFDAAVGCADPKTADGRYCGAQLNKKSAGNPKLQPEKSTQFGFGLVFDATKNISFTLDYFNILQKGLIGIISADTKLQDYIDNFDPVTLTSSSKYSGDVFTTTNSAGQKVIDFVNEYTQNLGQQKTQGLDFTAKFRFPGLPFGSLGVNFDASYLLSQKVKDPGASAFGDSVVGQYATFGPALRLKDRTEVIWSQGGWEASAAYNFQSGYRDQQNDRKVGTYETFDLGLVYKGIKNLKLTAGIMNLKDRNPPASNQNDYFQVGYDPTNTNPKGRTFLFGAQYKFF